MGLADAPAPWLWIPLTVGAAFATTVRNASQRQLVPELGELGATLVRFIYALPFAITWLLVALGATHSSWPRPGWHALLWIAVASLAQIGATALLLRTMHERNFALGAAYSNTQVLQVALFAVIFLGDPLSAAVAVAIVSGTAGVLLLAPLDKNRPLRALAAGFTSPTARLGLACGALFALTSVASRGAALSMPEVHFLVTGAYTVLAAQLIQTAILGSWLLARRPQVIRRAIGAWRYSLIAGSMGAMASAGWNTAYAIEPVAHVRTLGLIELVFSYAVSRRLFREQLSHLEMAAMGLLSISIAIMAFSSG